jgi:hypothetical protein
MPLHDLLQGDGPLFTAADAFHGAFSPIQVLDLFQVLEDGFTNLVGLGAPGTPGKLLQALSMDSGSRMDQHNYLAFLTSFRYSGNFNLASAPRPSFRFSKVKVPPCPSAICRLNANPIPVPPFFVVKNGTNTFAGF